jgi:hypothetical protein
MWIMLNCGGAMLCFQALQVRATIPNFQGKPEDLWLVVWLPLLKQERKGFDSIIMLVSKNI